MLPDPNRLRKTKEIERVFKEGRGLKEGSLLLKVAPNSLKLSRFAFVAGQKASKKAIERNKAKRILREIIRSRLAEIKSGFDVVITALQGSADKNFEELERTTIKLLKKTGLLND
jgi:ribonuclease P protein component